MIKQPLKVNESATMKIPVQKKKYESLVKRRGKNLANATRVSVLRVQIPRLLGRKEQARSCPISCCGVFDWLSSTFFYTIPPTTPDFPA